MANEQQRVSEGGSAKRAGACIVHAARAMPWYRRGRTFYTALAGGLFVFGILLGTMIGLLLLPSGVGPPSTVAVPALDNVTMNLPEGSPIPVIVRTSESMRRRYEESLVTQLGQVRPDPDLAPPLPHAPSVPKPGSPPPAAVPQAPYEIPNAVPVTVDPQRPMIAFVFDDLGIDQPRSREALALPGPMTMAFLPYGHHLQEMVRTARGNGHEILVHVPMAPLGLGIDPGPNALDSELGAVEILRRLDWDLDQFSGYVGINNHMGSRFTANPDSMRLVIAELRRRGLVFMDSVTTPETKGYGLAAEMGVPYAVRDVFLDHDMAPDTIRRQLARVEKTAQRRGYAVAVGHPHDATLAIVRDWLKSPEIRAFQLVPISAVIRRRMAGGAR